MREDEKIILIAYFFNWITLIPVLALSTNPRKVLAIHLGIQVFYSAYFWYQLLYNSSGGTALIWWVFLLFTLGIHLVSYLIQIVILLLQRRKRRRQ